MKIAKRTLEVSKDRLRELFGLPEEIELLAVRASKGFNGDDSFEFLIASAGEVEINGHKITIETKNGESGMFGLQRRLTLEVVEKIINGEEELCKGSNVNDWNSGRTTDTLINQEDIATTPLEININIKESKKDSNEVAKEIMKGIQNMTRKNGGK